jgi:DNA invertase Pin-like site-specific DNA recombinase
MGDVKVFVDQRISGAKARRPGLDRVIKGVNRRDFDLVATWSIDRLSRSLPDVLALLGELHPKGVGLSRALHSPARARHDHAGRPKRCFK